MKLTKDQQSELKQRIDNAEIFYMKRLDNSFGDRGAIIRTRGDSLTMLIENILGFSAQGYEFCADMPVEHQPGFYSFAYMLKPKNQQADDLKVIAARLKKEFESEIEAQREADIEAEIERRLREEREAREREEQRLEESRREALRKIVVAEIEG